MGLTVNPLTGKLGSGSPSLRFNPLAGEFQFSGGSNRIEFDPKTGGFVFSSQQGEVDPLAGIPYRLRFETNWGNDVLLPYFFQDIARTIPVTSEGDLMATGGPEDAELVPEQADDTAQPMLLIDVDSSPYFGFDGVNDCLPFGNVGGQVVYTVRARSDLVNWNAYASFAEETTDSGGVNRWGLFQGGTTNWNSPLEPVSVRKNGIDLTGPLFDMVTINQWMTITVVTRDAPSTGRALMQAIGTQFTPLGVKGVFIYDGIPSNDDRNTVETFYSTL